MGGEVPGAVRMLVLHGRKLGQKLLGLEVREISTWSGERGEHDWVLVGCSPQSGGTSGPGGGCQVRPLEQTPSWGFLWTLFIEGALSGEGGCRDRGLQRKEPSKDWPWARGALGLACTAGKEFCAPLSVQQGWGLLRGGPWGVGCHSLWRKAAPIWQWHLCGEGDRGHMGAAARWEDLGQALQRLRRWYPPTSHQRHVFYFGEIRIKIFNALENLGCLMAVPMSCWIVSINNQPYILFM